MELPFGTFNINDTRYATHGSECKVVKVLDRSMNIIPSNSYDLDKTLLIRVVYETGFEWWLGNFVWHEGIGGRYVFDTHHINFLHLVGYSSGDFPEGDDGGCTMLGRMSKWYALEILDRIEKKIITSRPFRRPIRNAS